MPLSLSHWQRPLTRYERVEKVIIKHLLKMKALHSCTSLRLFNYAYLITPWLYGPLRALASLITEAHSSLSAAFCSHLISLHNPTSFSDYKFSPSSTRAVQHAWIFASSGTAWNSVTLSLANTASVAVILCTRTQFCFYLFLFRFCIIYTRV